ncbi:MAG: hypothetical protein L0H96_09830 [Humibacillus sp.]|nr:hypothetical protein [Humibacillus sp.]MDN5777199.1 hypothetical protein [Humibacillus sp.]
MRAESASSRLRVGLWQCAPSPRDLGCIRVATMICYDVKFAEAVRAAALAGAHPVVVPTAKMHPFEIRCESVVPMRV